MQLGRDDLVLSAGTHLVTPLLDRLGPAKEAGYAGVSIYPHEVEALRAQGLSDAELRARVADAGLAVGELDAITTWFDGHTPPEAFGPELGQMLLGNTPEALCPVAEAIGARSITVVEFYGTPPSLDQAAEGFAHACDVAARHGVLLSLEFLPWAGIPDLATAAEIVRRADRPNGGLLVDSWHLYRCGATAADVAALAEGSVAYVQLDDAPAVPEADLAEETQHRRLVPGDGELDLVGLVRALDAQGYDGPLGVEVFSDELTARPFDQVARTTYQGTARVVAAGRAA